MMLYIRMLLTMVVALYTSRVVLNTLGVEDYGIYSLVGGFISLFSFLNAAMSSATQRYLTFDLGKNDSHRLRKTFSVTLTIHMGIALIVLLFAETLGLWYINNIMVFPVERSFAVNVVYQFSIAATLLSIIQVPYNALIIAHERMNVYAYVSIVEVLLKLLIVFLLVLFGSDKLITYSILTFIVALSIRLFYQFYCRRKFKESHYKFEWDKGYYKELISFSGWSLFGNMSAVARGQGVNVVLNLFFGTTVNAAYGIALQVQSAVGGFATNFQLAVSPQIVKQYAQGNIKQVQSLVFRSAKFSYLLLIILVSPIFINIDYILYIWLKNAPEYSAIFIQLSLIYLLIDSLSFSLIKAVQATGRIKYYQIVLGTLTFMSLPLSYIALKYGGSPETVFIVLIIVTFSTLLTRMFFVKKLLEINPIDFMKYVLLPISIVTVLISFIGYILYDYLIVNSFLALIGVSVLIGIISLIFAFFIGVNRREREVLLGYIIGKIKSRKQE